MQFISKCRNQSNVALVGYRKEKSDTVSSVLGLWSGTLKYIPYNGVKHYNSTHYMTDKYSRVQMLTGVYMSSE